MSFDLGVWRSEMAPSVKEALALYLKLCQQKDVPLEEHQSVQAFYSELCARYPEIDTLSEAELEQCPWSCAHDRSGRHVLMCLNYGDELQAASLFITELAAQHGLICFDPQGPSVYLPPNLQPAPQRSWLRFW